MRYGNEYVDDDLSLLSVHIFKEVYLYKVSRPIVITFHVKHIR